MNSPFEVPGFKAYWSASFASNIGNWMQMFAEQWLVLILAGAGAARWGGRLGFAAGIAMLIFTPVGGFLADRFNRRKLLMFTQVWLLGIALLLCLAAWRHWLTLPRMLGFACATGLGSALFLPMSHSVVGDLVPVEKLQGAMALLSAQFNLSRILGPPIAALLFPLVGASGNFGLNALTFVGLIVVLWRLPLHPHESSRENSSYRDGFKAYRDNPTLGWLLFLSAVVGLFALAYVVLLPVYGTRYLGLGERGVAGLISSFGAGAVAGAMLVGGRIGSQKTEKWILGASATFGLSLAVLGLALPFWFSCLTLLVMGMAQATSLTLLSSLIQRLTPAALRGRVSAIYLTAIVGLAPIGNLVAGEVAQALGRLGPLWVFRVQGLLMLLTPALMARLGFGRSNQAARPPALNQ